MKKYILGIAGFIGSGKSTAGQYFQKKGVTFIDADEVVAELYQPQKPGYLKIVDFFGKRFLTKSGKIDTKKLGKFVFNDPLKLRILNSLIHPLVASEIQKKIDAAKTNFIVIEAVYFEEKYLGKMVDAVLWVEAPAEKLIKRGMKKLGMTEQQIGKILRLQQKPAQINFVISNSGSKQKFFEALEKVWEDIQSLP